MSAAGSSHELVLAGTVAEARSLREFAGADVVICRDRLPDGVAFDLLERGSQRIAILIVAPGNEAVAAEGASFGVRDYVVRDAARKHLRELPGRIEFVFRRALARRRVVARTAQLDTANRELRREIAERQRLEREIVKVSESEQERLGQDLHDDLGQQLSGISMLSSVLEASLRAEAHPKTEAAARLAALLRETVRATRELARGLFPVDLQHGGLILALTELAQRTQTLTGVQCEVRHDRGFRYDDAAAIHLYRIAQEALNNATRYGRARHVITECVTSNGVPALIVTDDGVGFKTPKRKWSGIGLHLYRYRARVIGAQIKVARGENGGCKVLCLLKRPSGDLTDGWRERSKGKFDSRLVPD
jgi:signal transduction histidine kinase